MYQPNKIEIISGFLVAIGIAGFIFLLFSMRASMLHQENMQIKELDSKVVVLEKLMRHIMSEELRIKILSESSGG